MKKYLVVVAVLLLAGNSWAGGYPENFNYNQNTNNNDASAVAISGASASVKSDIKNTNINSQYQGQTQGQLQGQFQGQGQGQKQGINSQINPNQVVSPYQSITIEGNYIGEYPTPFTTPMPSMQTPSAPKAWQLALSLWEDGSSWPYANIADQLPPDVDKKGRIFTQPAKKGTSVTTYKKAPKNYVRLGTYVIVAKTPTVDATVLEDAALWQAKMDGASGIVERERNYYAKNNHKGGAAGAGLAISALGSMFQKMAEFGPYVGGQYGSYVSDQDCYIYLSFDTIEVR